MCFSAGQYVSRPAHGGRLHLISSTTRHVAGNSVDVVAGTRAAGRYPISCNATHPNPAASAPQSAHPLDPERRRLWCNTFSGCGTRFGTYHGCKGSWRYRAARMGLWSVLQSSAHNMVHSSLRYIWWTIAVARVIRLVKPSVFNPSYCTVTLAGLSRVRLQTPHPPSSKLSSLPLHPVDYPPQSKSHLSEPACETFRACTLKLLERLDVSAKGKMSGGNRLDWRRMKVVVEEAGADRLPWVAGMPSSSSATLFLILHFQTYWSL